MVLKHLVYLTMMLRHLVHLTRVTGGGGGEVTLTSCM